MTDRIQIEGEGAPESMVEAMTRGAYPGVFAGGKQIVRTQDIPATDDEPHTFVIEFDDGGVIAFRGIFDIAYKNPPTSNAPAEVEQQKELPSG